MKIFLASPAWWKDWHSTGIFSLRNTDLQDYIEDDDYYRNTYLTNEYIRRRWSNYFRVVEIIPAYIGNQRDLIILQKPV